MNVSSEKVKQAEKMYGVSTVYEVMMMVGISDADGMYTTYEDMGEFGKAECVEFLYFE
jgi:lysyl-tRNA synthetase class I